MKQTIRRLDLPGWGIRLYRFIRYRGGFGVHSPFVFALITKVIEEHASYYCYEDIELIRKQFLFREEQVGERSRSKRTCDVVKQQAIAPKLGQLLFRLANHFETRRVLQIGCGAGFSTLYLTAWARDMQCIVLEEEELPACVARKVFEKAKCKTADLRTGSYATLLPKVWVTMPEADLVFFNAPEKGGAAHRAWLDSCLEHRTARTVIVIRGIRESREMQTFWEVSCRRAEVRVAIDLYDTGLLIFNPKLHKRNYIVYL